MRCTPILCCCSLLLAAACRQAHPPPPTPLAADYTKAESLYNAQNDSAFYYFNKVAASATDSLQAAMAYSYMGIIQSAAGDYFGSQESLLASLKHLDETNTAHLNCLLSDYNELGRVSLNLKNYEDAITYDDKALQFTGDTVSRCIVLSNKAVAHQKKKQYRQALSIYDTILHQSLGQPKRYARILSNMAYTRWLQEPRHQAGSALLQALRMQDSLQDTWGRNASYAHLSAYYRDRQPDSALLYARQMYTVAQNLRSPDDELEALEKLLPLESPGAVRALFARYQSLNDSLQTSRNNAKNQFALIRYEVAKNKADNLVLQSENTDKKWQIRWQWALIISLILGSFALVAWLRKRRQRLLREQQLKTSQKVHDVVANGLYQLMRKIEYAAPGPGVVLDELEALYEQSRDISYDHLGELPADYSGSLATLLLLALRKPV